MPNDERNLMFVPASDGKQAHYITQIRLRDGLTGKCYRIRRFSGSTKQEARAYLSELRVTAKQGKLGTMLYPTRSKGTDTFGQYARTILDSTEWKAKRSNARNEASLMRLNQSFENVPLADIKPVGVRRYMTERHERDGAAPGTVNRELSFLKSILYAAEADELIPSNPIRGRRVKKLPENNHRERIILDLDLTNEKLALLIDGAEDYLKPIMRLAMTTGMRRDEILESKWKDFSLTLRTIRIPAENAKSKKERVVPVDVDLAAEIDALPRLGEYIFINPATGERRKDVSDGFAAACRSIGIETGRKAGLVFHDLRHVAASHLVKATDVVTAARILGHSSLDMTMRYVHPTDADKHEAVNKVAENLFGRGQKKANAAERLNTAGDAKRLYA